MERVSLANAGGLDLLAAPLTIMDFDLPSARKNADGLADELAGKPEYERHYDDAPWSIQVKVEPVTDASISALCSAFRAGNMLSWNGISTRLVSGEVTADEDHGTMRLITFGGTRRPAWRDAPVPFTATVANGSGTVAVPTVGGTLAASMDVRVTSAGPATMLALGIKHAPTAAYDPFDTNGVYEPAVAMTAAPKTLWAGQPIDASANRGQHLGVMLVRHTASVLGAVKYRMQSTIIGGATWQDKPTASTVVSPNTVAVEETLCIGKVSVPAAPLPYGFSSVVYGDEAIGVTGPDATNGSMVAIGRAIGQTYTNPGGQHNTGFGFLARNDNAYPHTLVASIWPANNGVTPDAGRLSPWVSVTVVIPPMFNGSLRATWAVDLPLPGPVGIVVEELDCANSTVLIQLGPTPPTWPGGAGFTFEAATGWVAGYEEQNGNTMPFDLCFTSFYQPIIDFSSETPVTVMCSQAGKSVEFNHLTRIPADIGAAIVPRAYAYDGGWYYSSETRAFYPSSRLVRVTGTAITPLVEGELVLPPGENTLVIHGDEGAVTVDLWITEQRITRG